MKETFYFSHDYNARNDEKILELRSEFGPEGYAAFFMMLESMAENDDNGLNREAIGGLSLGYGIPRDRLDVIIEKCINLKLFYLEDGRFFSKRMIDHKNLRKSLSEAGKNGAKKRWENKGSDSQAITTPLPPPMASKVKESKGKENNIYPAERGDRQNDNSSPIRNAGGNVDGIPRSQSFSKPTPDELKSYFSEKGSDHNEAKKFYYFYESKGWLVGKVKMKDWRAAASGWIARNKQPEEKKMEFGQVVFK
jgi:hypothetical protein